MGVLRAWWVRVSVTYTTDSTEFEIADILQRSGPARAMSLVLISPL